MANSCKSLYIFNRIKCDIVNNSYLLFGIEFVALVLLFYLIYFRNPYKVQTKHPMLMILLILFVLLIFIIYFFFIKHRSHIHSNLPVPDIDNYNKPLNSLIQKVVSIFGIFAVSMGLICMIYLLLKHVTLLQTFSIYILTALQATVFLAFVYLIVIYAKGSNGISGSKSSKSSIWNKLAFLVDFVFYIPCLLLGLIDYVKYEYKITAKPIWILLLVELVIIMLYFFIPFIIKHISFHDGTTLVDSPIYTNVSTTVGTFENLSKTQYNPKYKYNYGLSFFLYLNPQPTNTNSSYTKYTSVLNYGNKPNILYNGKKNSIKIVCQNKTNDLVTIYESSDFKYQKWMHFIINYSSGTMDVFINNKLVSSKSGLAPYMTLDKITVGEDNGIYGGIKELIYFNRIIPTSKILLLVNSISDIITTEEKNIKAYEKEFDEDYNITEDISRIKEDVETGKVPNIKEDELNLKTDVSHDVKTYTDLNKLSFSN